MKKTKPAVMLAAIATLTVLMAAAAYFLWFRGARGTESGPGVPAAGDSVNNHKKLYQCPMHPAVIREQHGHCPICGMELVPMQDNRAGSATGGAAAKTAPAPGADGSVSGAGESGSILYYRDPMHPWLTSDKPGKAPDCGMDMVPVYASAAGGEGIRIDPGMVQNIGVRIDTVRRRDLSREVRTTGAVGVDETRQYSVNAKIGGWVEKLYADYTGMTVKPGQPLLEIYSPELVATQEEYLQALRYANGLAGGPSPEAERNARDLVESARRRLRYWDIPEPSIEALEKSGRVRKTMTLYAPGGGVVLEKRVVAGQNVMPGTELFRIADLSKVWVLADLYQADLAYVRKGQAAEVELAYLPGGKFNGIVTFITPYLEGEARTAQVRVELPNTADYALKPEMAATVTIRSPVGKEALVVPDQSVIRSGRRNVAIVAVGNGHFEPREVEIGASGEGYLQILSGLREGERIVVSSQFLIDSESNLKAAVQSLSAAPAAPAEPHRPAETETR